MSRYINDKVNHKLIPVSGYGSRVATSVEDKTLTVHGSFVDIDGYNYGKADITDAVELIAPIESTLVASRNYTVGKQFVYRGFLYKVTAPIALDEAIVIGTNCELAPDVSEQIGELNFYKDYTQSLTGFVDSMVIIRKGNLVTYTYNSNVNNIPAGQSATLGTIPVGYRPSTVITMFRQYGPSQMIQMRIGTNGIVSTYNYGSAITSITACRFGSTVAITEDPIPS